MPDQLTNNLAKALDVASVRHQVGAHNLANAETPGFQRKYVEFEKLLKGRSNWSELTPRVVSDKTPGLREDSNNVDLDAEAIGLAENASRYQVLTRLVALRYHRLQLVTKEAR